MLVFPGPSPLPPPSLPQPATNADAESEGKLEPPESELHAVVETDSEADAAASAVAPPPRPFSQSQRPRGRRRGRATRGKPTSKGARRMAVTSQPEGCRGESFKPWHCLKRDIRVGCQPTLSGWPWLSCHLSHNMNWCLEPDSRPTATPRCTCFALPSVQGAPPGKALPSLFHSMCG